MNIGYVLRYHREWYNQRRPKAEPIERKRKTEILDKGDGCACRLCERVTKRYHHQTLDSSTPDGTTIEHKLPEALGGTTDNWNLEISCWICNTALGNMLGTLIGKYQSDVYQVTRKELEEFIRFHWNPKPSVNSILWKELEEEIARLEEEGNSDSQSLSTNIEVEESRGLANPLFSESSDLRKEVKA